MTLLEKARGQGATIFGGVASRCPHHYGLETIYESDAFCALGQPCTECYAREYHDPQVAAEMPKNADGWVRVEDDLPKDQRDVQIACWWHEKWNVRIGWYTPDAGAWIAITEDGTVPAEVTHWMPLPEPPKEV